MSNIDKQALRGQSVKGSFYLVECCNCGEMYPSNFLDGGEAIADSGDYGDCYCHLCGADDTERADWGDVNSNEAKAWNFQQKRIEALLDELEAAEKRIAELSQKADIYDMLRQDYELQGSLVDFVDWQAKRIAKLTESLPEAVSVPEEMDIMTCHLEGVTETYAEGWNAYRAAMLQGAENAESRCSNSSVVPDCSCRTCRPVTFSDSRFVVCHECGNKRCPHANDHRNACTGRNEPGQEGSAYPAAPQQEA